jgi:hypothetical protein
VQSSEKKVQENARREAGDFQLTFHFELFTFYFPTVIPA